MGVSGKNQVEQNLAFLIILEGKNCTFQCNDTVSPFNNLGWYKQNTGRGLIPLIIMTYNVTRKSTGRYTATLDQVTMHSSLHITATQLNNSALYIVWWLDCALAASTQTYTWRLSRRLRRKSRSIIFNAVCNFTSELVLFSQI